MANKETFQADVAVALKAPDAANLDKLIASMLAAIDKIPASSKTASTAVGELLGQIKKIKSDLDSGISLNGVIKEVKTLGASLKSLQTLGKGVELFSNKDVDNINQARSAVQSAARAFDEVQKSTKISKGVFGMDETTVKGVTNAVKVLQTELKAVQQAMDTMNLTGRNTRSPVVQQRTQLRGNLAALETHGSQLQDAVVQAKLAAGAHQDGLKEEVAYQARIAKVRTGYHADGLREEVVYQNAVSKAKTGLQQDQLRDEVRFQKEQTKAQGGLLDGRVIAANTRAGFATSPLGRTALVNKAGAANQADAQWADPSFVDLKGQQAALNLDNQRLKTQMDQFGLRKQDAALSVSSRSTQLEINRLMQARNSALVESKGTETEVTRQQAQQLQNLKAKLALQKSSEQQSHPETQRAAEMNRANSMMARVTGSGGAALLAVQASLIANYSVLTTAIGGVRNAITTSVELEAAFRNVQAVTATTSTEMRGLEKQIMSVAATSKFSSVEVAGAALILGQAGMSAKQVGEAIPAVVALAVAAGTTLAQAVDLVTSVLGVFDKNASDTADIANKITQAANSSKVSVEKLALGLQYAGNIAAQSGISFEETTAAMAAMSNAGIKSGSTMGSGLRQFLTEVAKPSKEFLETLHQLGLSLADVDFRSNGLVGVVSKLREAGFTASEAIKSFDVRGAAAFNALLADPAALDHQYQMLLNTKAAVAANEIQMDSLQAQSKRLTTSMGNLASTGLEPLSKGLTVIASGLATVIQGMTEYPGVMQVMVTATAGFMALALVSHYKAMFTAGMELLGVTRMLTTATTSLTLAFEGLSMTNIVGIAIVAATAAFMLYKSEVEKTKDRIDELKAATSEAKAAFEEKSGAVQSLTKKIEDLQYKESVLKGDQAGLTTTAIELNSQYGHLGMHIDTLNPKFDEMIQKLRTTRSEMQGLTRLNLGVQLAAEQSQLKTQTEDLVSKFGKARGDNLGGILGVSASTVGGLGKLIDREGGLANLGLTGEQQKILPQLRKEAESGTDPIKAGAALQQFIAILATASKMSEPGKVSFEKLSKALVEVTTAARDASVQTAQVAATQRTGAKLDSARAFDANPMFNGKTYTETLPPSYEVKGSVVAKNPGLDDLAIFDKTAGELRQRISQLEGMKATIRSSISAGGDAEEGQSRISDIDRLIQENVTAGGNAVKEVDELLKIRLMKRTTALKLAPNKANRSVLGTAARDVAIQEEIGALKAQDMEDRSFGASAVKKARGQAALDRAQAESERLLANAGRKAGDHNTNEQIAALKKEADSLAVIAKGDKISASAVKALEAISPLLDDGIAKLLQAKGKRLAALALEQERKVASGDTTSGTKAFKDAERKAMAGEEDAKILAYIAGFREVTTAVDKRLDTSGRKMNQLSKREEFQAIQVAGEERLYAAAEEARRLELGIASGDRNKAGLGIQSAAAQRISIEGDISYNKRGEKTQRSAHLLALGVASGEKSAGDVDLKRANLADTKIRFEALVEQMKMIGDETSGWLGDTIQVYETEKALRLKITAELAALEARDPSAGTEAEQLKLASDLSFKRGQLSAQQAKEKSAFEDKTQVLAQRRTTRKSRDDTEISIAQQVEAMPQEATLENLSAKMDQVWGKYKKYVRDMDVVGTMGRGVTGVLESSTGSIATFFSSLASGSASASQAFKTMAVSIIRSMMDVLSQALAMQAVKGILGMFGGVFGGAAAGGTDYSLAGGASLGSTSGFQLRAKGGAITGGIPGRDSVGVLAMPGEFMLKKSAVDAVGMDYLSSLNAQTNSTLSTSSGPSPLSSKGAGDTTNIWIVPPATQPTMGPRDVVVAVTDDMMRGGVTRTLIKQIQAGG